MKFILVTGGFISGIGKGVTTSSLGVLLQNFGLSITTIKIDPYFNVDAGLMSPYEHGEVYVLNDGTETDLDLGNYERFLGIKLTRQHNITSGRMFLEVINNERNGKYLGKTVQLVPHISDHIKETIIKTAHIDVGNGLPDVCIIELGGTIGDMESAHFYETIRKMIKENPEDWCAINVSLLCQCADEYKTKPIQNTMHDLRKLGIPTKFLVLRTSKNNIPDNIYEKLASRCEIDANNIIVAPDMESVYMVPNNFSQQNFGQKICKLLSLPIGKEISNLDFVLPTKKCAKIGIIGKYTGFSDAYLSVIRAIERASIYCNRKIDIVWINSDADNLLTQINECSGIIIPGGFGERGIENMIKAAEYTLDKDIPTLGLCLGYQVMALAIARKTCKNITSEEFSKNGVHLFKKGEMKLGLHKPTPRDFVGWYENDYTLRRFRHRYHLTQDKDILKYLDIGLINKTPNKFWLGVQFHPEFDCTWKTPSFFFVKLIESFD